MPAALLALGAASFALLVGTDWIRERLVAVDMVRLDALVGMQLSVTTVHLWLEEYVTGDDVPPGDISRSLDRAADLLRTIVDGGRIEDLGAVLPPLEDEALRSAAVKVQDSLERFDGLSRVRRRGFENAEDVGIGSALDVEYDRIFAELMADAATLDAATRDRLAANTGLSRLLFRTILLAWVAIVVLAVTGLWTRERRRQKAAQALAASEARLIQAQKMEAVGRLAGGITHDINNYLAAITTNCELVQMKADPGGPVARKMGAVLGVVAKASSLLEQLLAFSRQQPVQARVVNLNAVIGGLEAMIRRLIGEAVRLETRLSRDLWTIEIDPSQVEQILINLVLNARQAMTSGGRIAIETGNTVLDEAHAMTPAAVRAGEYVMLAVSDTGPGIPAEIRDKIFEPFFTTKAKARNSGLGLSTTYGIVKQNGGHVWVYSEPGRGATFKIYLPRSLGPASMEAQPVSRAPVAEGGTESILLVEDNDELRESTLALLRELGYRVTAARDGSEALERFRTDRSRIDLLITDVVMPGMSGKELFERIAAVDRRARVIFISGYTDSVMLQGGFGEGHLHVLQKPFSAAGLAGKIREVLDGGGTEPRAGA